MKTPTNSQGLSLMETVMATLLAGLVALLASSVYSIVQRSSSRLDGRIDTENTVASLQYELETRFRTAIAGAIGVEVVSISELILQRENGTSSSTERISFKSSCETITNANLVDIVAGAKFPETKVLLPVSPKPAAAPYYTSTTCLSCPVGKSPVVTVETWPSWTPTTPGTSTKTSWPSDSALSATLGLKKPAIGLALCFTSDGSSDKQIAGSITGYYSGQQKDILSVEQSLNLIRGQSVVDIDILPN